jgi:hypothetical protein
VSGPDDSIWRGISARLGARRTACAARVRHGGLRPDALTYAVPATTLQARCRGSTLAVRHPDGRVGGTRWIMAETFTGLARGVHKYDPAANRAIRPRDRVCAPHASAGPFLLRGPKSGSRSRRLPGSWRTWSGSGTPLTPSSNGSAPPPRDVDRYPQKAAAAAPADDVHGLVEARSWERGSDPRF